MSITNEKLIISSPDGSSLLECNLYDALADLSDQEALTLSNPDGVIRYVGLTSDPSHPYLTNCQVKDRMGNAKYVVTAPYIIQHTVNVIQPENGTIYINGQAGTSFTFAKGTQVTAQHITSTGFYIKIIEVGGTSRSNPYTWYLTDDTKVSVSKLFV